MTSQESKVGINWASFQSFIITFSYSLALQFWKLQWILIDWLIKLSVLMFQPLIVTYRRISSVCLHSGWTSINRPLSYSFRSLGLPSPDPWSHCNCKSTNTFTFIGCKIWILHLFNSFLHIFVWIKKCSYSLSLGYVFLKFWCI